MPKLAHSVGRLVLVAIPAFFGDEESRQCRLVDLELSGVWLQGDDVEERLSSLEQVTPPAAMRADVPTEVFVPFEQIVYLVDPAQFALGVRSREAHRAMARRGSAPGPATGRAQAVSDSSRVAKSAASQASTAVDHKQVTQKSVTHKTADHKSSNHKSSGQKSPTHKNPKHKPSNRTR
jgi:hypothetical protein